MTGWLRMGRMVCIDLDVDISAIILVAAFSSSSLVSSVRMLYERFNRIKLALL